MNIQDKLDEKLQEILKEQSHLDDFQRVILGSAFKAGAEEAIRLMKEYNTILPKVKDLSDTIEFEDDLDSDYTQEQKDIHELLERVSKLEEILGE